MKPPARSRRMGFTLIELLVVTAIIMLLVAILLPSLRSAQESGRKVRCQSNLRQIVLALHIYIQDNENRFPAWYVYEYDANGNFIGAPSWAGYLTRIVPSFDSKFPSVMADRRKNVLHCPTIARTLNVYNLNTLTVWTWPTVYVANINLLGNCPATAGCPVKISAVRAPENTVFIADGHLNLQYGWSPALVYDSELDPATPGERGVGWVHNNSCNTLYVDGHVGNSPSSRPVPGTLTP